MSNPQGKSSKRKASAESTPVTKRAKKGSNEHTLISKRLEANQSQPQKNLPESVIAVKNEITRVKKASTGLHAALDNLHNIENIPGGLEPDDFNQAVIEALDVPVIIARLYGVKNGKIKNEKRAEKLWPMVRPFLKNILILSKSVIEPEALINIVGHGILPVLPLYREVDSLCKALIKQLVIFWNTSHEKLRILSFCALYRISKFCSDQIFEFVTKEMYSTYLQTCKHTSKSTITMIDFMRTSLREIYVLNTDVAYKQGFVNIRQLAVLLRSAIAHRTQDNLEAVFHWQFFHSLRLWEQVISMTYPCPRLEQLIYPLTQVSLGVLDLQKSPSLYPMYFHMFKLLTNLSQHTKSFITIIPHMLKMLDDHKAMKQSKEVSIQSSIQWEYIFRLSETQLNNSSFGDQLVNMINEHLVEYLAVFSSSIAFPELASVVTVKLEDFIGKCKLPNRTNTIRATLEIIQRNTRFIESRRNKHAFNIKNDEATNAFEIAAAQAKPPLITAVEKLRNKKPTAESGFEDDTYNLAAIVKDARLKAKAHEENRKKSQTLREEMVCDEFHAAESLEEMDVDEEQDKEDAGAEDDNDDEGAEDDNDDEGAEDDNDDEGAEDDNDDAGAEDDEDAAEDDDEEELDSDTEDCEEEEDEGNESFVVQDLIESDVQMESEESENPKEKETVSTEPSKKKKNRSKRRNKSQ